MILRYFLSRQKHNDSDSHEIIPIFLNMLNLLNERYYNIGNLGKYLVQTQSLAKSSGIKLPEVHGVSKGLDPNILPEKQVIKPEISKVKETLQIEPRVGQGRAGIRWKRPQITHPISQSEKQPVKIPEIHKSKNIVTTMPSFATPVQMIDDSHSKVIDRQVIQNANREIPFFSDPIYRPPPKPVKIPIP